MDIIEIDLTPEQIAALAPLQALVKQSFDAAQDALPVGKKPFLPPLGMVLAQIYMEGKTNQMCCAYIPPQKAAEFYQHFRCVMGIK